MWTMNDWNLVNSNRGYVLDVIVAGDTFVEWFWNLLLGDVTSSI